ncbi:MAG: peptidylprolyl isomerase [Devosia sp.]|nr:peptidylprolyl isomerase [Devosia sp.]
MTIAVNGVEVSPLPDEAVEFAAVRELLRQRAVATGLLPVDAEDQEVVSRGIEELLSREVETPELTELEARRYYDGHPLEFRSEDLVYARHILFQVTPSVNVPQLRDRAEETLNALLKEPDRFEEMARQCSNCPSGQQGGNLGQLGRGDTVPEFERALFRPGAVGLVREVVKTRFGFHIVAVDKRLAGEKLPFDVVRDRIAARLRSAVQERALRQYVSVLAGTAVIDGVELDAASTPLVQ